MSTIKSDKLYFQTVANPLKGQGTAVYDYVGQFLTNGTVSLDALCEKIAKGRANLDAPTVKLVVKTIFAVIADGIAEDNVRYNLDGVTFETAISGSVPSMDGALTDENELYVLVTVGDPIRGAMAALTATNVGAADASSVRMEAVEDAATCEKGVVRGTDRVLVTGRNLSASRTGEGVTLVDCETLEVKSTGTVAAEDGLGQRIEVNFAAPFAAGAYWLVLATRGYATPDAEVATYRKKVTATEATAPTTITKVVQEGRADDTVLHNTTSPCVVHGTGLALGAADKVLIELYRDGVCIDEGDLTTAGKVTSSSDTAINLSGFDWNNRTVPDGDWWDAYPDSKLIVVKNGVRYEHPITFKGE